MDGTTIADALKIIIIGSSGGLGRALALEYAQCHRVSQVFALSRAGTQPHHEKITHAHIDITDEDSIKSAATALKSHAPFDIIIAATGLLSGDNIAPEKSMRAMEQAALAKSFAINAIGPALAAKEFLPLMRTDRKAVFAALSARVGSISDNRLGGWYAYRASKAALNMIIKTLAIEHKRKNKLAIIAGLHPGTVDTALSIPFQKNVPASKLFTPEYSAKALRAVIDDLTPQDSGDLFGWDGKLILP